MWQPPPMPAAPVSSTRRPNRLVSLLLAILVSGAVGYWFTSHHDSLPGGTSAFASGHGITYTASDNSYTAQFPEPPTVDNAPKTVGNVTMSINSALVSKDDYEMGAASIELPVKVPSERVNELLADALDGGVNRIDGTIISKQRTTRGGFPALDARFKAPDGYTAHAIVFMNSRELYVLFVHAKTGTEKLFQALNKSFVPLTGF